MKKHGWFLSILSHNMSPHVTTEETGSAMDKRYRETALGGLAADYERSLQETPQLQLGTPGELRGGPGSGEDPLDSVRIL